MARATLLFLSGAASFATAASLIPVLFAKLTTRIRRANLKSAFGGGVEWTSEVRTQTSASPAQGRILEESWANDPEITAFKGTFFAQPHPYVTPEGLTTHGALAWAEGGGIEEGPRPGIVLVHTAVGPQDLFLRWRAQTLATRGYVVLIADMYGDKNGAGWDAEWSAPRKQYYADHREMLQQNLRYAISALAACPLVDDTRLAAVGYCFGGRAVLDLLKGEEPPPPGFRGVVSFHGIADEYVAPAPPGMMNQPETPLQPPSSPGITSAAANLAAATADFLGTSSPRANASDASAPSRTATYALISTARADPFIPNLGGCLSALTARNVMWELQQFGPNTGAKHGFTNPAQRLNDNKAFGYTPIADKASWRYSKAFLETILE